MNKILLLLTIALFQVSHQQRVKFNVGPITPGRPSRPGIPTYPGPRQPQQPQVLKIVGPFSDKYVQLANGQIISLADLQKILSKEQYQKLIEHFYGGKHTNNGNKENEVIEKGDKHNDRNKGKKKPSTTVKPSKINSNDSEDIYDELAYSLFGRDIKLKNKDEIKPFPTEAPAPIDNKLEKVYDKLSVLLDAP